MTKFALNKLYVMEKSQKRQRFEKVASNRVQKILNLLSLLQNCSNKNNYEYTEDDVEHMFTEIQKALKDARNSYYNELSKNSKVGFSFSK